MKWATAAPSSGDAHFRTPHGADTILAKRVLSALREDHPVTVLNLLPTPFQTRSLGDVAAVLPEVSRDLGRFMQRRMKTVAMVDSAVHYRTPTRRGAIGIKGERDRGDVDDHIFFANRLEAEQFSVYGTAEFVVVLQPNLRGNKDQLLRKIGQGIPDRIRKILVVTNEFPHNHMQAAYGLFGGNRTTIGYFTIV